MISIIDINELPVEKEVEFPEEYDSYDTDYMVKYYKEESKRISNLNYPVIVKDGDTILSDTLDNITKSDLTGVADYIIQMYEKSTEKDIFVDLFATISGISFNEWLYKSLYYMKEVK